MLKGELKLSVVTISYNQAEYLEECICSVLNQSYKNFEYIVVDPGSTDGSREIITKYKSKISRIIFEKDDGPANGLNKGFSYASGDIYSYINSDDYYLEDAFGKIVECYYKCGGFDVLHGNGIMVNKHGEQIRNLYTIPWNRAAFLYRMCPFVQQSTFFTEKAFKSVNGFNEKNISCWDGELMADLSNIDLKFVYLNQRLSAFRFYDESISGSSRLIEQYQKDRMRFSAKMFNLMPHSMIPEILRREYYRMRKMYYMLRNLIS